MHVTASAASEGGSGTLSLLIVALPLLLLVYLIVSQRRRARREAKVQQELRVGDSVMTRAGMFGTIAGLNGPVVDIEVAPGVMLTFDRRAVIPAAVPGAEHDTIADDSAADDLAADDSAADANTPDDSTGETPGQDPSDTGRG